MSAVAARMRRIEEREVVFIAAVLAVFMVSVESTIVATAMPTIVADLGGLRLFSWVFGIYFLTQAVTIPIYGRLADMYGRKGTLIVAVALFLAGSILSGFAHNMVMLIVFRALQGLGGGGVQPIAATIVADLYTGPDRARVQGILSSTWGVSAVLGPVAGAFLIAHAGWPSIFWINVPFGIVCMLIVARAFHENVERRTHQMDYVGSLLLAAGIGLLMYVFVMAGSIALGQALGLGAAALALIAWLIVHELRIPEPMLALRLFGMRAIAIANGGCFIIGVVTMGITAFLPVYVQGAMGDSPILAGSVLGLMSVAWSVTAVHGGRLMARTSYRTTAVVGSVFLIAGSALLMTLEPSRGVVWAAVGAGLIGAGFGYTNIVYVVSTQSAVGWQQRGAATSSLMFLRQVGQALGTAGFGAVFNLGIYAHIPDAGSLVTALMNPLSRMRLPVDEVVRYSEAIARSLQPVYAILGLLSVVTLAIVCVLPRGLNPASTVPAEAR